MERGEKRAKERGAGRRGRAAEFPRYRERKVGLGRKRSRFDLNPRLSSLSKCPDPVNAEERMPRRRRKRSLSCQPAPFAPQELTPSSKTAQARTRGAGAASKGGRRETGSSPQD